MSRNVTQLQVFVSCPGDVESEKQVIKKVCDRINTTLLNLGCSIQLKVRDWREIIGKFGPRPQGIINETISRYDIYLGILWMRFGTPPGSANPETGNEFQSGTEEEFYLAYEEWKKNKEAIKIYVFFKDSRGTNNTKETEQLLKVQQFKETLMPNGWVNSFNDTEQFKDMVHDLLTEISTGLCIEKKTEIKGELLGNKQNQKGEHLDKKRLQNLVANFSKNIEPIDYYIPRSVKSIKEQTEKADELFQVKEYTTLNDVVLKSHKVVVLGNAGTGKSVELQQLASNLSESSSPFIPVYKRFNTYVNEDIESFLPHGWDEINPEILLFLFDGLDEVQPEYFNTAIRKILNFSEKFPEIRLVISCRTNFYELPTKFLPGTLPGFECYFLNDVSLQEIKRYTSKILRIDDTAFINEAYRQGYLDLLVKPFFLKILISHYNKYGNLKEDRANVIKGFILSRIALDEIHFRTTIDTEKIKNDIVSLLQRVALAMEMLGRNFITSSELLKVVETKENFTLLKYFSAFNRKSEAPETWQFEHNNIQEYLAAAVLASIPIAKIKQIVSFRPTFNKIRPSWVNTLSFLTSIVPKEKLTILVDWIVSTEREIVVKFEKDRIKPELRTSLFIRIFEDYKSKGIWLRSNKFSDSELAHFAQSNEVIEYLLGQLTHSANSRVVKLNAIRIIDNIDFGILQPVYLQRLKLILFDLLENEKEDAGFVYSVLGAMSELRMNDKEILKRVVDKFGKRYNQYIRSGLYKLIGSSEFVDDYIDIFLDGILISDKEDVKNDREPINLADESWFLKEGLSKATSPEAIKKILKYFGNPTDRRYMSFYEKKDVFKDLIKNAIKAYKEDTSLYNSILDVFVTSAKIYDLDYARPLTIFFEQTRTKNAAFKFLWNYTDMPSYEKGMLLAMLADKEIIDFFIDEYLNRNFTNDDVTSFHKDLQWYIGRTAHDLRLIEYLEQQLQVKAGIEIEKPPVIDYEAINQAKAQENFDILFDTNRLLTEVERVFEEVGDKELNFESLWEVRRKNDQILDDYFPASVLGILRDFTRNRSTVNFKTIKDWVKSNSNFIFYQIQEIYNGLKSNEKLVVSSQQNDFIKEWSTNTAAKLDWSNIVTKKGITDESFYINQDAGILWYFVTKLNVPLNEEQILGFTLFKDFARNINDDSHGEIDFLKTFIDASKVNRRVIKNILEGIPVSSIWKANALYAIDNNLNEVFGAIIQNLKDETKSEYQRRDVLVALFNKTKNFVALREILKTVRTDGLGWKIIELLSPYGDQKTFLVQFLKKKLNEDHEAMSQKLEAAGYLIELNDQEGLDFYTAYLLEKNDPTIDFHQLGFFQKLNTAVAIPNLLKLLSMAKQPEFQKNHFNHLESVILAALQNIGIASESNLIAVKGALLAFISLNLSDIPHINFLHFTIDRIEEQFYMNKSKSYTIEEAINEIQAAEI